jgi:chemosensory pili system protein ChpA (sensor histidine kinase/response regulator)
VRSHGIEDAVRARSAGKDSVGTITIDLQQEGNDVSVSFPMMARGWTCPASGEGATAGPGSCRSDPVGRGVASLIFMPGFHTATEVTELAGRGIGMDVVRSEVNRRWAAVSRHPPSKGEGTSFKLVLPLTTAVTQVVMLRSGTISLGVPANLVELVRRVTARELQQAYSGLHRLCR